MKNTIKFYGKNRISLTSPKGVVGLEYKGSGSFKMNGSKGGFRFKDEKKIAEVETAIKTAKPAVHVSKLNIDMAPGEFSKYDWKFVEVVGDAHGRYSRKISEAVIVKIGFGKEEVEIW